MAKKKKKTNLTKPKPTSKQGALLRPQDSVALALGASLVIGIVLFLSFFTLTRASLAPVYVGAAPIGSTASEKAVEKRVAALAADHRLTLRYPDKSQKSYNLSDAGLTVNTKQSAQAIRHYLHQNLWERLAWWQPIRLELKVATNKTKLNAFIASKATVVSEAPQDATLSAPDGMPTITPEKAGSGHRVEQASSSLTTAAITLNSQPLILKKTILQPAITAKNLIGSEGKLEGVLSRKVTFSLANRTITPTRADIADWIELTPVKDAKTVDVTVNSGKIVAYIDEIADPYVYLPRDKLVMNTANGPLVLDYGGTGTDVGNKNEAAAQTAKQLLKGEIVNIELTIKRAEAKMVELQPYDKLIVVDTGAKQMYAYEKTNLVRTIPVSAGAPNTPTVLGQYKIYSKRVSQDMRGANVDGSRYFQAAVPYVNYFYGSYAIHGNYWRPDSWFGSINSSHGCVGINDPDDAWIYNWAPIGTPVIVHE